MSRLKNNILYMIYIIIIMYVKGKNNIVCWLEPKYYFVCLLHVGYILTRLSFCAWDLLIVMATTIFIGNRLCAIRREWWDLMGVTEWILGMRIFFSRAYNLCCLQCSFKPVTNMCCYHQRPMEANMLHVQ